MKETMLFLHWQRPFHSWNGRFFLCKSGAPKKQASFFKEVMIMTNTAGNKTRKLTTLAMLAALAIILVAFIHFPLIPAAPFLEYDPADIPILIGSFVYGPWVGLGLTAVVSILQGVTVSAASGPIGIIMHLLATGSCVTAAGLVYRRWHTRKGAVAALCASIAVRTVVMCGCNLVFTPLFLGQSVGDVVAMLIPAIIPFNFLYAAINSAVTFVVYKPISAFLHKNA